MPDRTHELETAIEYCRYRFAYQPNLRRIRTRKFWHMCNQFFWLVGVVVVCYYLWVRP